MMILHVNFLTVDGKNIIYREYGSAKVDHDLLAGFLSAFSGFMKEISQSEIKSTVLAILNTLQYTQGFDSGCLFGY